MIRDHHRNRVIDRWKKIINKWRKQGLVILTWDWEWASGSWNLRSSGMGASAPAEGLRTSRRVSGGSLQEGLVWRLGAISPKYSRASASILASSSGGRCSSLRLGLPILFVVLVVLVCCHTRLRLHCQPQFTRLSWVNYILSYELSNEGQGKMRASRDAKISILSSNGHGLLIGCIFSQY